MAIIMPFVLISCGDDKDEPSALEQQLIGIWIGGQGGGTGSVLNPEVITCTFNANHTGRYLWQKTDAVTHHVSTSGYDFKWSLKKNVLTIRPNSNDDSSKFEISIENGVLKMKKATGGLIEISYEFHKAQG